MKHVTPIIILQNDTTQCVRVGAAYPTSVRATLLDIVAVNMRSSFTEAALCLLNEFSLKL